MHRQQKIWKIFAMNGINFNKSNSGKSKSNNSYFKRDNSRNISNMKIFTAVILSNIFVYLFSISLNSKECTVATPFQKYTVKKDHSILTLPIKNYIPISEYDKEAKLNLYTNTNQIVAKEIHIIEKYISSEDSDYRTASDIEVGQSIYKIMIHNKYISKIINSNNKLYNIYPHGILNTNKKNKTKKGPQYELHF